MINRVIRALVVYDFVLNFAFGLSAPIFAVFILQNVDGSTIRTIGLSATFYWIARTLSTVPLSRLMDKTDGERDEFYFILIGAFCVATIPLLYLMITETWHLYAIQFLYGIFNSMAIPAWRILFTDHLDQGHRGYEWSLEDIGIGIAVAGSAYLGAIIADRFGFQVVFIMVALLGYASTLFIVPLYHDAMTRSQLKRSRFWSTIMRRRHAVTSHEKNK